MTDLENPQKQDRQIEEAMTERDQEIFEQIAALFEQLSPLAQIEVAEAFAQDEDDEDDEDDLSEDDDT